MLLLRKSDSPFLLLQSLRIQPLPPPHFCHSAMLDLFSSKLFLLFPLYLKHCCQRTLSKVSASSRSCCDLLNNPPSDLPSEQDEVKSPMSFIRALMTFHNRLNYFRPYLPQLVNTVCPFLLGLDSNLLWTFL